MPISHDRISVAPVSRKAQVIQLLDEGNRVKDIAQQVGVSSGYVSQIANMLGVYQRKAHLDFRGLIGGSYDR